jgi:hypothetical protein
MQGRDFTCIVVLHVKVEETPLWPVSELFSVENVLGYVVVADDDLFQGTGLDTAVEKIQCHCTFFDRIF